MLNRIWKKVNTKKSLSDDKFLKRIRSLVIGEGMLQEGNIPLIEYAIINMPENGCVVEIGSYGGLSTNLIIYLMQKNHRNNIMFNCDAWIYEGFSDNPGNTEIHVDGRNDILRTDYSLYMKQAFIAATKLLSSKNLPHSFHLDSDSFFDKWNKKELDIDLFGNEAKLGGEISFAYIDGGHSLEIVSKDFKNVADNLLINGFILMDDSSKHLNFGSAQIIAEIKKDFRFEVVASSPNYMFKKVK